MFDKEIDQILFKPCMVNVNGTGRLVMIFRSTGTHSISKGPSNKVDVDISKTISVIDIDETINQGHIIVDDIQITSDKILSIFVPVKYEDYQVKIASAISIISEEYMDLQNALVEISRMINALLPPNAGLSEGAVQVALKSIFLNTPLNNDEISVLAPAMLQTIASNIDIDLENKEEVEELRKKIELAIINCLPVSVTIEDVKYNMDEVKSMIMDMRRVMQEDDDMEQHEDEG